MALRAVIAAAVVLSSCAFQPVEESPHLGRQELGFQALPLNVLFLVDASGSSETPMDPAAPSCPPGCGPGTPCPPACLTRWRLVRQAMEGFVSRLPPLARAAIAIFPDDPGCEAPSSLAVAFTQAPPLEALLAPAEFSVLGDRVILAPAACNGVQAGQSLSFFVR